MDQTINYRDKKLSYATSGKGMAVVLLHGFGEDATIWNQQVACLEGHYRLIIPHLPGSGSSEMVEDMSLEGIAESIHHILQQEEIKECVMIGHSMGGYIALAFAEKFPELLIGLGLFHSSAYPDSEEKKQTRKRGIEFILANGAQPFLEEATPKLYSEYSKKNQPRIIDKHLEVSGSFSNEALVAYYESMMNRPDRTEVLKQNKIPILFVLGRSDTAVPLEDGLQQAHLPLISYIHILENSGHMGMVEEVDESCIILK
ncbi:MAG TPA: alpha/beta hydrolase, partial [Chitinophagaceae bacterium]|nr:alpha/beta hydrolase [Chitinophagaceae bacterium]